MRNTYFVCAFMVHELHILTKVIKIKCNQFVICVKINNVVFIVLAT